MSMRFGAIGTALVCLGCAGLAAGADWLTDGADTYRTNWQKDEKALSPSTVKNMKLLWKTKLDNQPRQMHALFEPLSSYANAYANQLGCVFGCPPMFTNRLDLQKPDTGGRRRSPFAYLGVKWSQVQILSARPCDVSGHR